MRNNDRYRGHAVSALLEAAREVQYLPKSLSLVIFCEENTLSPETSIHELKEIFNYVEIFNINTQNTLDFTTKLFLCILDSSIFISKNYLREIFVTLQQKPQDTLLVPEFLIKYGLEAEILRIPELQNISPYVLVENIPFPPVFSCQSCLMTKIMAAGGLPSFDSARMLADAIAVGSIVERCNETAIFEHAASSNLSGFPLSRTLCFCVQSFIVDCSLPKILPRIHTPQAYSRHTVHPKIPFIKFCPQLGPLPNSSCQS